MSDGRPERVYGILVQDGAVFLAKDADGIGLPGGPFPPMADDRKAELRAHLLDQLGIVGRAIWAQGAFDYRRPGEQRAYFSGFYSVWEWDGEIGAEAGYWLQPGEIAASGLPPSLKILLASVLDAKAMRTT
jgi:hypothetical protein